MPTQHRGGAAPTERYRKYVEPALPIRIFRIYSKGNEVTPTNGLLPPVSLSLGDRSTMPTRACKKIVASPSATFGKYSRANGDINPQIQRYRVDRRQLATSVRRRFTKGSDEKRTQTVSGDKLWQHRVESPYPLYAKSDVPHHTLQT